MVDEKSQSANQPKSSSIAARSAAETGISIDQGDTLTECLCERSCDVRGGPRAWSGVPNKDPLFIGLSVVPYVYLNRPATGPDAGKILQPYVPQSPAAALTADPGGRQ
jgi:hypothetical protein